MQEKESTEAKNALLNEDPCSDTENDTSLAAWTKPKSAPIKGKKRAPAVRKTEKKGNKIPIIMRNIKSSTALVPKAFRIRNVQKRPMIATSSMRILDEIEKREKLEVTYILY